MSPLLRDGTPGFVGTRFPREQATIDSELVDREAVVVAVLIRDVQLDEGVYRNFEVVGIRRPSILYGVDVVFDGPVA